MEQGEVEFEMVCNCLFSSRNIDNRTISAMVAAVVSGTGNWVGGKLQCYETSMIFSVNALNRRFLQDARPVEIDYRQIIDIQYGKALLFMETVDVHLDDGRNIRFRGMGRRNAKLLTYLQKNKIG